MKTLFERQHQELEAGYRFAKMPDGTYRMLLPGDVVARFEVEMPKEFCEQVRKNDET